ncbi:hypothetical protein I7I53_05783 [Histoplasma capsulatum var. duboisii H88]|uniref:Secreted protein n=1 Tax=Ajellomyces capsulatus (strain H88) TaxID=544711 RepID=A0A8A1LSY1_AJEC8|nr:hypothetical protein I7I53_05783 [Histoplasma capsulatum var. duboisii H88]
MPFLLDFLFLSIFTLSPAPGRWFIVPNSDRVTRDIPSCIFVCCFLRQSFPLHIPFLGHFLATDEIGSAPWCSKGGINSLYLHAGSIRLVSGNTIEDSLFFWYNQLISLPLIVLYDFALQRFSHQSCRKHSKS